MHVPTGWNQNHDEPPPQSQEISLFPHPFGYIYIKKNIYIINDEVHERTLISSMAIHTLRFETHPSPGSSFSKSLGSHT
jgi:hypothetical protein